MRQQLLTVWSDLSHVKLTEALDDSSPFRRFGGFLALEKTPKRTAFVRFRKALVVRTGQGAVRHNHAQLRAKAIRVKTGTLVDATIIASGVCQRSCPANSCRVLVLIYR